MRAVAGYNSERSADNRLSLNIALVWLSKEKFPTSEVEKKVRNLLHRAAEKYFLADSTEALAGEADG